jgi:hypothetical protein
MCDMLGKNQSNRISQTLQTQPQQTNGTQSFRLFS